MGEVACTAGDKEQEEVPLSPALSHSPSLSRGLKASVRVAGM